MGHCVTYPATQLGICVQNKILKRFDNLRLGLMRLCRGIHSTMDAFSARVSSMLHERSPSEGVVVLVAVDWKSVTL